MRNFLNKIIFSLFIIWWLLFDISSYHDVVVVGMCLFGLFFSRNLIRKGDPIWIRHGIHTACLLVTFKPAHFDQFFILTSWFKLNHLRLVWKIVSTLHVRYMSHQQNAKPHIRPRFPWTKHNNTNSYNSFRLRIPCSFVIERANFSFNKNIFAFQPTTPYTPAIKWYIHMIRALNTGIILWKIETEWAGKKAPSSCHIIAITLSDIAMSAPYCRYDHRNFLTLEFLFSIVAIRSIWNFHCASFKRNTLMCRCWCWCFCCCVPMNEWMCSSVVWFISLMLVCEFILKNSKRRKAEFFSSDRLSVKRKRRKKNNNTKLQHWANGSA